MCKNVAFRKYVTLEMKCWALDHRLSISNQMANRHLLGADKVTLLSYSMQHLLSINRQLKTFWELIKPVYFRTSRNFELISEAQVSHANEVLADCYACSQDSCSTLRMRWSMLCLLLNTSQTYGEWGFVFHNNWSKLLGPVFSLKCDKNVVV
mgnify:CR=1 FL=1